MDHQWHGENYAWWNAMKQFTPKTYPCVRVNKAAPPSMDGNLDSVAWNHAPWTDLFLDIEGPGKPQPRFDTRAKMMWDAEALYVGAMLYEPQLVATITEKNAVIFHDNDFEVFIDPDSDNHNYYEFEMNAFNTIWELTLEKPYKDGGPAISPTNLPHLVSSVNINGKLNDPTVKSVGWSVVVRFPFEDLVKFNPRRPTPPRPNDFWRINFSRVQWRYDVTPDGRFVKVNGSREDNWTWSVQGIVDMHRPEMWGYLLFLDSVEAPSTPPSLPDPTHPARTTLMEVYHYQRDFLQYYKRYATSAEELGVQIPEPVTQLTIELTSDGFIATAIQTLDSAGTRKSVHVRQDSLLWSDD
eukprot:GILJ01004394.1.p1 GENE.GILJ01004394.1~~GILJ01004394.1.p1  ORF type:complete len:382 (-),score=63.30 GILJ01004394.1:520-1581(-)